MSHAKNCEIGEHPYVCTCKTQAQPPPAASDPPDSLLAGLRNGAWLDQQHFAPLTYAVDGLLPEGMTLLAGPPKAGKSWLLLDIALAVAQGGYALEAIRVEQRPVLLLALEDGDRRLQDRCRTLLGRDRIPAALNYLTKVSPGIVLATITAWMEQHATEAPLCIVDTLGKTMPPGVPGESAYARDYRIGGALKGVADAFPGSSLIVNHHIRKLGSDDFVDSVSGTHGLAGAADTIVILSRARHESAGILKVTGRDVREGEYALGFSNGGQWGLDGPDLDSASAKAVELRSKDGVGDDMGRVIDIVTKAGKPVGPNYVATALQIDDKTAGVYLGRAVKANRLSKHGRGQYAPVVSVGSVGSGSHPNTSNTPNTVIQFPSAPEESA